MVVKVVTATLTFCLNAVEDDRDGDKDDDEMETETKTVRVVRRR